MAGTSQPLNLNYLELVTKGTVTVTKSASSISGTTQVSYPGLTELFGEDKLPIVLAYYSGTPLPYWSVETSGSNSGYISSYTDFYLNPLYSTIDFRYTTPNWAGNTLYTSEGTVVITYYILRQTAN